MKKFIPLIILFLCSSVSAEEYIVDYTDSSLPVLNEALRVSYAKIRDLEDADVTKIESGDTSVTTNVTDNTVEITAAGTQEAQLDANGLTLKAGASVNEFSIDGTMAGNSDDAVPTEQAVKTYVDGIEFQYTTGSIDLAAIPKEQGSAYAATLTPTKKYEAIMNYGGTISFSYTIKAASGFDNRQCISRPYINGIAVGTEQTTTRTAYATYTENLDIEVGDLLQLYIWSNYNTVAATTKDIRIMADEYVGRWITIIAVPEGSGHVPFAVSSTRYFYYGTTPTWNNGAT